MSLIPSHFLDTVAAMGVSDAAQDNAVRYFATAFLFGYPTSPRT